MNDEAVVTYEEALGQMREAFRADLRIRRRGHLARGESWNQITPEEEAVFNLPPREVPRLVTLHQYCLAFHKTDDDHEPFRSIAAPSFIGSPAFKIVKRHLGSRLDFKLKVAPVETFLELGVLLDVPPRLAHAWYYKDLFWKIRDDFEVFPEPTPDAGNDDDMADDDIPF